jgi:outer membrane protein assembly factor BamB
MMLLLSGCDISAEWMSRLFDETHGGHTPDNLLTAAKVGTLKEKWRRAAPDCNGVHSGAGWYATPVTFKGVIYIGSDFGCLYAINEVNGAIEWSKFIGYQPGQTCTQRLGVVSSIRVADDGSGNAVLFFHSPDGYLYKLDRNGNTIWRSLVQIPSSTQNDVFAWSSPTVANGKVIIGVSSNCDTPFVQGKVIAYDAATGAHLWTHKTIPDGFVGAGDWYDAAVDGAGDVYVTTGSTTDAIAQAHPNTTDGFEQYSILKLRGSNGTLVWKAPAPKFTGDPDYATSPVLFEGGGHGLVGATNKDGWFRAYRRDTGAEVWQAKIGIETPGASAALSAGGVWDGSRLFVMSNATTTGGGWVQYPAGAWSPQGGAAAAGSIRRLDPATGDLVSVGGRPYELALPSNALAPCSINGNSILVCAGGRLVGVDINAHDNGLFVVDTTQPAAVLRHLEDKPDGVTTKNYGEFSQPAQENGSILAANVNALTKWGQ